MSKNIETYAIDGGMFNYGAWAVAADGVRVGTITEPIVQTYMEGNTFRSTDALGRNPQLHKTWEDAVARFQ